MLANALRRYVRLWDLERAEFEHKGTLLAPDGQPIHPVLNGNHKYHKEVTVTLVPEQTG